MKVTRKEFEDLLAQAKSLPAVARDALIAKLKAATVVEVDAEGKETIITVEIVEPDETAEEGGEDGGADAKSLTINVDADVKAAVDRALAEAKAKRPKNPLGMGSERKAFAIPAEVRRVGSLKAFRRQEVGGLKSDERAYRFGMWALAAIGNANAKAFCAEHGIGLKLHSTTNNNAGGYLVPEEFGTDLIDLREQYGVARRILKIRPMTSDTRTDPRRVSGLTAYFVGEGQAGTESTKGWDQVRLTAKDLMVISRMTNQLNEDSVINIGDDLAQEISYAFALKEDQCAFLGDGSSPYGGIVGVNRKLLDINGVDDGGGIVLASGNLFSEFVLGDFNNTVARLPQYADNPNTRWVMSRTFYFGTAQRLELAAGGVTAAEVRDGNRTPMFLGYPVEISQVMPSANANSQIAALLGDFSQAGSFGDRSQESIQFSEHATVGGESVFERNEIAVRGTERIDINIHDVGDATTAGPVVGLISAAN